MGTDGAAAPRLVVTEPAEQAGRILPLAQPQLLIGHSETADLVLEDRFVSRRHALVSVDPAGTVTITDLNSTGGTFVNGERLDRPRVLRPGDTVRFADLVARFEPGTGPAAAVAESSAAATQVLSVPTRLAATAPAADTPADAGLPTAGTTGGGAPVAGSAPAGPGAAGSGGTGSGGAEKAGPGGADPGPAGPGGIYSVSGTVLSPALPGVGGLTVQLVDKNIGGDQVLASTQTGSDGSYAFSQLISSAYLTEHYKTEPDLQVQVLTGGGVLASSDVSYSAPVSVTLNVVLPAGPAGLPSEYETLTANLAVAYPGSLGALQENASQQDITYLANKTGWDARAVALAALADQFSQITAPATTAAPDPAQTQAWPVPMASIRPEFYYALFRAGLPASADSLFQATPAAVQGIWQQAVTQGVIPQDLAREVPAAVRNFQALSAARLLTAAPPAGLSTLQQMLQATLPEAAEQQQFAQLYAQHQGDWDSFWAAAAQAFGTAATAQLQLAGQLYYLTVNNEPLVSALLAAEASAPLGSTLDLASRGYYEPARWAPLIGASVPPQIPGADADEQASNYAQLLAAQVRIAYPTAVAADQVRRSILPLPGNTDVAESVASFLTEQQASFLIGVEPVQAFINRTGLTKTPAGVITAIKRIQRVYQLTPDDLSMSVLLFHNLDSAFAITRYDSAGFVRAFAGQLGGTDKAARIHARARQVFATTLSVTVSYLSGRTTPPLGGTAPVQYGYPPQPAPPDYPVTAYPTLEDLFGSLDYCNCTDCGSILSPAAYLVDLLNYVDQPAPSGGGSNPQDVLLQRRPDLQYLPLTCANTNTALPYIDVVNELLEYYVANRLQLAGYQGHDTGDTISSAELIASPQYVNDAAYGILQDAFFPPPLPFSRPLTLLRNHLGSLGVTLPAAMTALRANDNLTNNATPASYGWTDILIEQLTISPDEYRLFTDPALQLSDLYGLPAPAAPPPPAPPPPSALTILQTTSLQDFSRRLGVSYDDLVSVVGTQFINPNAALIPRLEQLGASFATLQQLNATVGTSASIAADFIAALPAGLDPTQYGGSGPSDYQAVVTWVTTNYQRIMSLITISNPAGTADDCSGAALQFRYANPDNASNLLTGTDFLKLIRFIRLWQKLAPLLGDADDAVTIEQTDDILGALYPEADQPADPGSIASDPANRPLLDAGFATLLPRAGFLFQVLNSLSLTADAGLDQLLACWAPIGTAGPNSLYRSMFLTPTLLQQDPGAQTATVASTVNAGDVLSTSISDSSAAPVVISYQVQPGDTAATAAAAIAADINASTAPDPVSTLPPATELPLNSRFLATAAPGSGIITIKAGFTLACSTSPGASETYTAAAGTPLSPSATVAGPVTSSDTLMTTINGVLVSYQVSADDTAGTIAAGIAAAVNATTIPDPYSGLPLNGLVVASSAAAVVSFAAANAGAPFTLACSLDPANAGSYSAASPVPASCTASITGTVAPGDVLVTTINSVPVSYTAGIPDTNLTTLAANIAAAINAAVTVDAITQLPLSSEVQATSAGSIVTITATDPATPVTLSCSAPAADGYTAAGPFPETATATVSGTIPAGTTLTTTVNTLPLVYQAAPGDTPASIAAAIAAEVNATMTADPITSLPLQQVVTATAAGGTVTLTGASLTTPFTLAAAMSAAGYTAGQQTPPFADDGYGSFLADSTQTLLGHEPTLSAACNLTSAEFALITSALGLLPTTPLSLANISAVFRYGWLAHALGLSVQEFLLLREWTGLDPFAPLDPGTPPPAEPPVIRFTRLTGALQAAGLTTSQALYLIWNADISGTSAPPLSTVTGLAFALAADFAAVEAQFALQVDPDGSIAQSLMTLVYGATASAFFFGLLNSTLTTSVSYSTPPGQQTLPQQVIDASAGRLSYDDLAKQLTFAGLLDPATQVTIDAAVTASAPDVAALTAAVAGLATACRQAAGPFFATYPELLPLYTAFVASTAPAQDKRTALLGSFLPILKSNRKQEQALAAITAAAGTDPSFATALLQDPTILHADADVTKAAVTDLTAIENHGLSAQFFLGNDPASPPDLAIDSVPVLSYAQTAAIGGTVTAGDVLTTTINGAAIRYQVQATDATLAALAGSVAAAINAAAIADPVSGLPVSQVVTASVLPAGQGGSTSGSTIAIAGRDPSGRNGVFTLTATVSAGATETYTAASQLPAGTGGGEIAARWSGFLTVPQDGQYDINVAADPGSAIALELGGAPVPGAQAGGLWSNQGPISLTAGALVPIVLTAASVRAALSASWQSQGLGWAPIPSQYLYPLTVVSRLGDTYVRFLKAASLASALSLTAAEIGYLGTATGFSVNTTGATVIAPGAAAFTPASMANIAPGSVLVIDDGNAQETVTVTTTTPATFSAVAVNAHDGSASPFAIVSQSFPAVSQGWLNFLIGAGWLTGQPAQPGPGPATAASLTGVLTALADFARIKQALSPADSRLLAVLQNPSATLPVSPAAAQSPATALPVTNSALLSLTGWDRASVNALLTQFFGSTSPAALATVENFRRVYDAYALVRTCGLAAPVLISAITNAPTAATVSALQSALRAQYAPADWLTVIGPINDLARISQRDALVAYILQQLGDQYVSSLTSLPTSLAAVTGANQLTLGPAAPVTVTMGVSGAAIAPGTTITAVTPGAGGTTVTLSSGILAGLPAGSALTFVPPGAVPFDTPDSLYEFFLIDTQNQPAVLTSRILLALSTVQLFIERVVRNLEITVSPADIDQAQWTWMKRYRVWQANREVFLWPENWLYPELRDDQSPIFQQMMSSLLQGDITDDAAASAYLSYLTSLEEVAKLEQCGLYYVPGSADTDEVSYVVARTAGAHRKYYFRELTSGSWTPWTEVQIDCEDMPITPIVWNGRLFLFWLKVVKQNQPNSPLLTTTASTSDIASMQVSDLNKFQNQSAQASSGQYSVPAAAVLCWTEFYNGSWQPTKTSDVNQPTKLGAFAPTGTYSLESCRNLIRIVPAQFSQTAARLFGLTFSLPDDALMLAITVAGPVDYQGGFILHNTHSLPIRIDDIYLHSSAELHGGLTGVSGSAQADFRLLSALDRPSLRRAFSPSITPPYTGGYQGGTFAISYTESAGAPPSYQDSLFTYSWQPRWVEPQPWLPAPWAWCAPFIYEDRRHLFYVVTTEQWVPLRGIGGFGMLSAYAGGASMDTTIQPLILRQPVITPTPGQILAINASAGDPAAVQRYLAQETGLAAALPTQLDISYQGQLITPIGSLATIITRDDSDEAGE